MSRAGFSGFLFGGVFAVSGVGALSILSDPPAAPQFSMNIPNNTDAPDAVGSDVAPTTQAALEAPTVVDAPQEISATDKPVEDRADIESDAASNPVADVKSNIIAVVAPVPTESAIKSVTPDPVSANPKALPPKAPEKDAVALIETRPADPKVTAETQVQAVLKRTAVLDAVPEYVDVPLDFVVAQDDLGQLLSPPPELVIPASAKFEPILADTQPAIPTRVEAPIDETSVEVAETGSEATATEPAPSQDIVVAQVVEPAVSRPTIGKPAKSLITQNNTTDPEPVAVAAPAPVDDTTSKGALETFGVAFEDPQDRPLLSIVLMDQGQDLDSGPVGLQALGSFPYALSFAVDAELPDAADRAALYRSQGFEVLALVDLPESLTAADTEVAMTAALDAVPEAVGVLEGSDAGLQGNKDMSDQVTDILLDSGHGMLWRPNGLDTAQKLASREGVSSRTIFRDFDSKDQTPTIIRRFLDQAAFKAGQENGVVMVGRVRADTISALLLWGLQDRAQRVAVAPVSAILKAGGGS